MSEFYSYSNLITAIDQKVFDDLSAEIKVDKCNHKITGQTLFSVLLYNICEANRTSLRVMQESFNAHTVHIKHKNKSIKMSKSGIGHRLSTIDPVFFEKLLHSVIKAMGKHFSKLEKYNIIRCDSTVVTLSSKLAKCGAPVAIGPKHQVKMAVALSEIPIDVSITAGSSDNFSEEFVLKNLIKKISHSPQDIFVFDRGLCSRKTFAEFSDENKLFITRLKSNVRYNILKENLISPVFTNTLEITSDSSVQLYAKYQKVCKTPFRLISARSLKNGQELIFITNINDLSAEEITEIYKSRWDIEVFFKFIKQHLNTKHFLSRSENGVKVVFYVMLIAAILMLTFKELNKIDSYIITKMRFNEQIKRVITYQIMLLYENRTDDFKKQFLS